MGKIKAPKYSCGTDDICFCLDSKLCGDATCFRNPVNIIHKNIPHSFAHLRSTELCQDSEAVEV